jgi:UDP-glucose 4-epimerase
MKCAVLGGGGFIGSAIVDTLLKYGHKVRIFEHPRVVPYRDFNSVEDVEWMSGDFLSTQDINNAIEGVDVVFHLVSTTLPRSSNDDPIFDVKTNILASLQILNAMVSHKIPRIIFISSGGTVYGSPNFIPITELHPTEPKVSYGITKLTIEKYLKLYEYNYGIKSTILRVSNPYGERQRIETAQGAVGVFITKALLSQPIEIWGDGNVVRDYLYVGDVAEAFSKAMVYNGEFSIFNISSNYGLSLNRLLDLIDNILGSKVERCYLDGRSYDVPVNVLDNNLAISELGWNPKVKITEGLVQTVDWIKNQLNI